MPYIVFNSWKTQGRICNVMYVDGVRVHVMQSATTESTEHVWVSVTVMFDDRHIFANGLPFATCLFIAWDKYNISAHVFHPFLPFPPFSLSLSLSLFLFVPVSHGMSLRQNEKANVKISDRIRCECCGQFMFHWNVDQCIWMAKCATYELSLAKGIRFVCECRADGWMEIHRWWYRGTERWQMGLNGNELCSIENEEFVCTIHSLQFQFTLLHGIVQSYTSCTRWMWMKSILHASSFLLFNFHLQKKKGKEEITLYCLVPKSAYHLFAPFLAHSHWMLSIASSESYVFNSFSISSVDLYET